MYLSNEQYDYLMKPLRSTRVATRQQGGKSLSYLESWDVKAHLTRIFGFGNWDSEVLHTEHVADHEYMGGQNKDRPMMESIWQVVLRLTVRTFDPGTPMDSATPGQFRPEGWHTTTYSESAVGSATGGREGAGIGDLHDNAVKQAASDALKRCAINLGTQFGLSLYDNGNKSDVVRVTLVKPEGYVEPETDEAALETVQKSLGGTPVEEPPVAPPAEDAAPEGVSA